MKITSFKELLLKKAEGDGSLQSLIKMTKDSFFSDHIMEILEKMAEDKRRGRASNKVVQHFGDYSLDHQGDMSNMVHDALSHHASHYKAAVNDGQDHLAGQHMKKIHNIMHFSRKLGHDGVTDHGGGRLKIDAVDPKPWERAGSPKRHDGAKTFVTDTKGWSRNSGNYSYMQMDPHEHYEKETQGHGHTDSYPLEEMKVNDKHLHIDDNVDAKGYVGHEFDEHPIMKNRLYNEPPKRVNEETKEKYLNDLKEYEDSDHMNSYYDRHEKMQGEDPESYGNRGLNKPDKILASNAKSKELEEQVEKPTEESVEKPIEEKAEPKSNSVLDEIHGELTDEERNHPENKKLLEAIGSGAFNLDKDTALSIIRGGVKKSLNSIKDSLSKNKDFLASNPEILISIKDRLLKATDDADKWLQDNDDDYADDDYSDDYDDNGEEGEGGSYGEDEFSNLFDEQREDDSDFDDEDKHMVEAEEPEYQDINEKEEKKEVAPQVDEIPAQESEGTEIEEVPPQKKKRGSMYADWKLRDDYSPEHKEKMSNFINEGYNAGDAEILAGASKKHATIKDAAQHRVHPHEMSDKMHDKLKGMSDLYMNDIISGEQSVADPAMNPQKATAGTIKSYNDLMQDFRDKSAEFYAQDDIKEMSPRARKKAFTEWSEDYHKNNPQHEEGLSQEWNKHGETDIKNTKIREDKLDEDREAIAGAGQVNTEGVDMLSSGSAQMAGQDDPGASTTAGAYQSAGFSTNDDGKSTGGTTFKDPYTTFAEKNPEYTKKLKTKLEGSLDDKAKDRLKRIDMHKDE